VISLYFEPSIYLGVVFGTQFKQLTASVVLFFTPTNV